MSALTLLLKETNNVFGSCYCFVLTVYNLFWIAGCLEPEPEPEREWRYRSCYCTVSGGRDSESKQQCKWWVNCSSSNIVASVYSFFFFFCYRQMLIVSGRDSNPWPFPLTFSLQPPNQPCNSIAVYSCNRENCVCAVSFVWVFTVYVTAANYELWSMD